MQNLRMDRELSIMCYGIGQISKLLIEESKLVKPFDQNKLIDIFESRREDLEAITDKSTILTAKTGAGKTSLALANIRYTLERSSEDDLVDIYYINFGGANVLGNLGISSIVDLERKGLNISTRIDENQLTNFLRNGVGYNAFFLEYDSGYPDDKLEWIFDDFAGNFDYMLDESKKGICIFDDVQWLNLLPEETQNYFVECIINKLSAHPDIKVYLLATTMNERDIAAVTERMRMTEEEISNTLRYSHVPDSFKKLTGFQTYSLIPYNQTNERSQ